jgi:hypothetical protein
MIEAYTAVDALKRTERGRDALRHLREWFNETGVLGLDGQGKEACLVLIQEAFGSHTGTVRDAIQEGLGD